MQYFFRKPIMPFSLIFLVTLVMTVVSCRFSFADPKKAEKNAISFGADKQPDIKTAPEFGTFKSVFSDIAAKVIPTVVSITSTKNDTIRYQDPYEFFFGMPFDPFSEDGSPQRRNRRAPNSQQQIIPQTGVGSGVIVSAEGHIITNFHVVGKADEISVKLSDGRSFDATVVGSDSLSDVAVIKVKEKVKNLPVAYLGNSDNLRPGDWAMAIGTPFNLASTVTVGIISAINRSEATEGKNNMYQNFIQTDAAINPGNSGGALVNIEGEVIGINTMIYSRSGGYMGIGFAIPMNMAKSIMEDLLSQGKVSRGWLGVQIQDVNPAMRDALGLGNQQGVLISDVFKGEPADKAGIKRGDIVLNVNSTPVTNVNQLRNMIATVHPGSTASIGILRNGKNISLNVKMTERTEKQVQGLNNKNKDQEQGSTNAENKSIEKLGLKIAPLNADIRRELGLDNEVQGVVISEVVQGSQAQQEGLARGDLIREVNQRPVGSVKDFNEATKGLKGGSTLLMLIDRDRRTFFMAFKVRS